MDFSTKALAEITKLVAEEIGKRIEAGEINKLDDLENGVREMLQEIIKSLEDIASVEQPPRMESGRMMSVMLSPLASGK